jgi:AcrR family transcriptional regulator
MRAPTWGMIAGRAIRGTVVASMMDAMDMASPTVDAVQFYEELWAHVQPESSRRLLISALDCFAVKGFEGASTREIAERAGVSPAGLYVHYRSKNDLLFEISRIGHQRNWEETEAVVAAAQGPTEKLVAFVESFVIWHARFHTLARVCQYELKALRGEQLETVRAIRRRFQRDLEAILDAGVHDAEFDVEDRHGTARAILSLGIDVARWFTGLGTLRPEDVAALYVELALRMVRRAGA